jgi:hypothetical protein
MLMLMQMQMRMHAELLRGRYLLCSARPTRRCCSGSSYCCKSRTAYWGWPTCATVAIAAAARICRTAGAGARTQDRTMPREPRVRRERVRRRGDTEEAAGLRR